MIRPQRDQILNMVKKTRVLRLHDAEAVGISGAHLVKHHDEGALNRPSRRIYVLSDDAPSEQLSLVAPCQVRWLVTKINRQPAQAFANSANNS